MSLESVEVLVGRIGRAHGVRGDVAVDVRTDEPDRRFAADTRYVTPRGELTIRASRWHSGRLLLQFDGIDDRSAAEGLRGIELRASIEPGDTPDDPEEFYDHELTGLRVESAGGDLVGTVAEVLHLPAQDTLVVRGPDDSERLVPFVSALVPVVDLDGGRLIVADRPGLLADLPDDD